MNKKAFSLIELLVVLAIIGSLSAILLPAIGKARGNARRTQCANNLRQIGMAVSMFTDDHNFKLPLTLDGGTSLYWFQSIAPYLDDSDVLQCPDYKNYIADNALRQAYAYNFTGLSGKDIDIVTSTSQCLLVTDSGAPNQAVNGQYIVGKALAIWYPGNRHSKGFNAVFVDLHIQYVPYDGAAAFKPSADPESILWWNY